MKIKKILKRTVIALLLFVFILILIAQIFKDDIIKISLEKVANTFSVPLTVGSVDFSLLRNFPSATIEFNNVVVMEDTLINADTLASINELFANVDILQLIDGNIMVHSVDFKGVKANYLVDSLGKSNIDFILQNNIDSLAQEDTDTSKIQGVYALDNVNIEDIKVNYVDSTLKAAACLSIPNVKIKGKLESSGYKASIAANVVINSLGFEDYKFNNLKNSNFKFNAKVSDDTIYINNAELITGIANLKVNGFVIQKDSTNINLKFIGKDINIEKNIETLPKSMLEEFKIHKAKGNANLDIVADGFITSNIKPSVRINFELKNGGIKYDTLPQINNINISAKIDNGYKADISTTSLVLNKFSATIGNSTVSAFGTFYNPDRLEYLFNAKANVSLEDFKSFIPDSLNMEVKGGVDADFFTTGVLPDSINDVFINYALNKSKLKIKCSNVSVQGDSIPSVNDLSVLFNYEPGVFLLSDLKVKVPDYNVDIIEAYATTKYKGKLTDYENLKLQIDSFFVALPDNSISLNGYVNGFKDVDYKLNLKSSLTLEKLMPLMPDSILNDMSGKVKARINSKGSFNIDSIADKAMTLAFENSKLNLNLENVSVDMPDTIMCFNNLSGNVNYDNDTLKINKTKVNYAKMNITADSVCVASIYSAAVLNKPKELFVYGKYGADSFDYAFVEKIMGEDSTETVKDTTVANIIIPEENVFAANLPGDVVAPLFAPAVSEKEEDSYEMKFNIKAIGKVEFKKLIYGKAIFNDASCEFMANLEKNNYVVNKFKAKAFDGELSGAANISLQENDRLVVMFKGDTKDVEMSKLMYGFDNFYQEDFTSENLFGKLKAHCDGRVLMKNYEVVFDSLLVTANMKLEEGAIVGVQMLEDIEKIPGVGLSGLDNLKFNTLKSSMFIKSNKMYIPKTDIYSTSIDMIFMGMQSFGDDYEYHVKVPLSQVLGGKSKKKIARMKKNDFKEEKGETKGRYFVSKEINGKSKAWFDTPEGRRKMKAKIVINQNWLSVNFDPSLIPYNTGVEEYNDEIKNK